MTTAIVLAILYAFWRAKSQYDIDISNLQLVNKLLERDLKSRRQVTSDWPNDFLPFLRTK